MQHSRNHFYLAAELARRGLAVANLLGARTRGAAAKSPMAGPVLSHISNRHETLDSHRENHYDKTKSKKPKFLLWPDRE